MPQAMLRLAQGCKKPPDDYGKYLMGRIMPLFLILLLTFSFVDSGNLVAYELKSLLVPMPQLDERPSSLQQGISVRIVEFGLYRFERIRVNEDVTQATGSRAEGYHFLIQATDQIPAKLGITFGIGFVVDAPVGWQIILI
jgi:hypothetical protein